MRVEITLIVHAVLRFHSDASKKSALSINVLWLVNKPCFSQMLVCQSENLMPQFVPDFLDMDPMPDCREIACVHRKGIECSPDGILYLGQDDVTDCSDQR